MQCWENQTAHDCDWEDMVYSDSNGNHGNKCIADAFSYIFKKQVELSHCL